MLSPFRGQAPGTNLQSCAPLTREEGEAHLKTLSQGERAASLPAAVVRLGS